MLRALARVMTLCLALQTTGCYKWVEIKPAEVVKLNGSYRRTVGSVQTPSATVTVVESTVAHVERPDGTLVELKGEYDARVGSHGSTAIFDHPVNSRLDGDFLIMTSGNRAATPYVLNEVDKMEVSQPDVVMAYVVGILAGVGAAVLVVTLLSSRD